MSDEIVRSNIETRLREAKNLEIFILDRAFPMFKFFQGLSCSTYVPRSVDNVWVIIEYRESKLLYNFTPDLKVVRCFKLLETHPIVNAEKRKAVKGRPKPKSITSAVEIPDEDLIFDVLKCIPILAGIINYDGFGDLSVL